MFFWGAFLGPLGHRSPLKDTRIHPANVVGDLYGQVLRIPAAVAASDFGCRCWPKPCGTQGLGICQSGSVSKPCTPVVHIKIAGKWMFIPLKIVLIGIDPYPSKVAIQHHPASRVFFAEKFLTKSEPLGTMCSSEISGRTWRIKPNSSCAAAILSPISWSQIAGLDLDVVFFDPYGFGNCVTPHSMAQKNGKPDFQPIGVCFPFQQHTQIDLWLVSASLLHPPAIWRRFLLGQTKQVTSTAANFATDGLCRLGYITNNNAMTGCENGNIMEYPILKFHGRY